MLNKRSTFASVTAILSLFSAGALLAQSPSQGGPGAARADVDRWMTELSNWGRWGASDQLGTLNLITPEKRRTAARLVRDGVSVSLSRDLNKERASDNPEPFQHTATQPSADTATGFNFDTYTVAYHGYATTHLDALSHMFYRGRMYNGITRTAVTAAGASALGIGLLRDGIFTRGILIDLPRVRGVDYLGADVVVSPADLEAWEKSTGITVASGDAVFIRTGRWVRRAATGPWSPGTGAAGLDPSCARWLKARDVAFLGSDAVSDHLPSGVEETTNPIHQLFLVAMGGYIFDNCDLDALAAACAARNRWEFLLTGAPLRVVEGTGSPLNPIATF